MSVSEPGPPPARPSPGLHGDRPLVVSVSRGVADLDAPALSAAVALEVMGWRREGEQWFRPTHRRGTRWEQAAAPSFAADPREASIAVSRALADGWHCTIQVQPGGSTHSVTLRRRPQDRISSAGDSMPQAACRAILELARSRWRSRPPSPA